MTVIVMQTFNQNYRLHKKKFKNGVTVYGKRGRSRPPIILEDGIEMESKEIKLWVK